MTVTPIPCSCWVYFLEEPIRPNGHHNRKHKLSDQDMLSVATSTRQFGTVFVSGANWCLFSVLSLVLNFRVSLWFCLRLMFLHLIVLFLVQMLKGLIVLFLPQNYVRLMVLVLVHVLCSSVVYVWLCIFCCKIALLFVLVLVHTPYRSTSRFMGLLAVGTRVPLA